MCQRSSSTFKAVNLQHLTTIKTIFVRSTTDTFACNLSGVLCMCLSPLPLIVAPNNISHTAVMVFFSFNKLHLLSLSFSLPNSARSAVIYTQSKKQYTYLKKENSWNEGKKNRKFKNSSSSSSNSLPPGTFFCSLSPVFSTPYFSFIVLQCRPLKHHTTTQCVIYEWPLDWMMIASIITNKKTPSTKPHV